MKEFNAYLGDLTSGNYGITTLNMSLEGDTQSSGDGVYHRLHWYSKQCRYSDEEMNSLFDQTRSETDTEKRAQLFDEIFEKAQEEAIYAVLCNPLTLYAYNAELTCPNSRWKEITLCMILPGHKNSG